MRCWPAAHRARSEESKLPLRWSPSTRMTASVVIDIMAKQIPRARIAGSTVQCSEVACDRLNRQLQYALLPPDCVEEEEYILLHPPMGSAGSDELYA